MVVIMCVRASANTPEEIRRRLYVQEVKSACLAVMSLYGERSAARERKVYQVSTVRVVPGMFALYGVVPMPMLLRQE